MEVHFLGGIKAELADVDAGPAVSKTPKKFKLDHLPASDCQDIETLLNSYFQ